MVKRKFYSIFHVTRHVKRANRRRSEGLSVGPGGGLTNIVTTTTGPA